MKLVRDYLGFAILFAGIGYMVLWPLTAGGNDMPFGGSYVCNSHALSVICDLDQPLTLPPALHVLGAISAMVVIGQLAWRVLRRLWRPAGVGTATPDPRVSALVDPRARRSTMRISRQVTPRREFGLRRSLH
jgi:hypothetical protein